MRTLKIFFYSLILMFFNIGLSFSDITASVPTNLIQSIATSSSFTSLEQISPEAASEIQNTTSSIVDGDALKEEVQESAEVFGEMINEVSEESTNKFVVLGGKKNEFEDKRDLEPTLGTIIYDTGLITLDRVVDGHYDTDNKDPSNNPKIIFSGTQQARVKVYVDFNRKVIFGSVESRISLANGSKMTNIYDGASTNISDEDLPVDKELVHTVSSTTGLTLDPEGAVGINGDGEPFPYLKNQNQFLNSLLDENGDIAPYDPTDDPVADLQDMVKSVSHGTDGDKNVIVQARFLTAGSDGTPGKSVASFEAYNGVPCSGVCNTAAEKTDFKDGIERYSKTVTTTATKYTGELPQ